MREERPTMIKFARPYSDGSGDEFAVQADLNHRHGAHVIIDARGDVLTFPLDEIDWMISALEGVRRHLCASDDGGRG